MNEKLEKLCYDFVLAKRHEDTIRQERIRIEEEIASLVETPEVGQKTVTTDSGIKVTVKRGYNYKADCEAIRTAIFWEDAGLIPPIKTKTTVELDEKGYEWYKNNHPELFNKLAQHVQITPKKVAVTIKES